MVFGKFQSTLPLRGATNRPKIPIQPPRFQSTLPLRGATTCFFRRPPDFFRFQSTLPLRGATAALRSFYSFWGYFNPRSPYGERLIMFPRPGGTRAISIHAPLTGSDTLGPGARPQTLISIHAPLTGSDASAGLFLYYEEISIHAPLTGSDITKPARQACLQHFNPRSPYGERLLDRLFHIFDILFQSTLPLRGATTEPLGDDLPVDISIHAPLTGSDQKVIGEIITNHHFNPRSPYGERPGQRHKFSNPENFNPRSPYGERPPQSHLSYRQHPNFNPRSPYGERLHSKIFHQF